MWSFDVACWNVCGLGVGLGGVCGLSVGLGGVCGLGLGLDLTDCHGL